MVVVPRCSEQPTPKGAEPYCSVASELQSPRQVLESRRYGFRGGRAWYGLKVATSSLDLAANASLTKIIGTNNPRKKGWKKRRCLCMLIFLDERSAKKSITTVPTRWRQTSMPWLLKKQPKKNSCKNAHYTVLRFPVYIHIICTWRFGHLPPLTVASVPR